MRTSSRFPLFSAAIRTLLLFLFLSGKLFGQRIASYSVAGLAGYFANAPTTSSAVLRSSFYSNSSGDAVSKEVHFRLTGVQNGDSIILLSDTVGFEARSLDKSTGWINVNFKSGLSTITGARTGFGLSSGDTSINFEIKYDRASNMASSSPKKVRIYYKNSVTGVVNTTAYFDFAPRIYTVSNTYRWTGATSKDFSTSTNWVPSRTSPSTSDILIFDQFDTADVEIRNNGNKIDQEIGQLMITQYTKVRFTNYRNNGDNSISTIKMGTSNTNKPIFDDPTFTYPTSTNLGDFAIGKKASLIVSGTDTICFYLKTGAVYGNTSFSQFRRLITRNDRGAGAVMKLYFEDDITDSRVFLYTAFKPEANTTIYLDGSSNLIQSIGYVDWSRPTDSDKLLGGPGTIVVGPNTKLSFEDLDMPYTYLAGKLFVLGEIAGQIESNVPTANTEAAWNSWEPYLQFGNDGTHRGKLLNQEWFTGYNYDIEGGVAWQMYNSGNRAWRTVGFPISNMHVSQISRNIVITGTKNSTNKDSFFSFNSSCAKCNPSLYSWDESNSEWSAFESGTTANKIDAGEGVLLFFRGLGTEGLGDASASATAGVMNFKGSPIIGSKTVNLNYNSSGGSLKGVNLVANPYLCNVDWNALTRTNVANKFYYYDPAGKMYNTYDNTGSSLLVSGTNAYKAGTTLETRTIEQGSAFFVIATGSSASIKFEETDKISTDGSASAFREERIFPCNRLTMNLISQDPVKKEMDHATLEWDMTANGASKTGDFMDMPKIYGGYYGIGTTDDNGEWYVIDRRPDIDKGITETVNIKTASHEKTGSYFIDFEMCPEGSNAEVVLIDRLLGTKTNLENGKRYGFDMSTTDALTSDRFALEISKTEKQNALNSLESALSLYPNPAHSGSEIFLAKQENVSVSSVTLLDINGKEIQTWKSPSHLSSQLDLKTGIYPGIYILTVETNQGKIQKQLVISNP